jgi:hypothetical protein
MYKLAPHQIKFSKICNDVLQKYNICYLAGEVRSQKTGTAFEAVRLFGAQNVIFITKKQAISSIESDHQNFGFDYKLTVINYESLHKVDPKGYDFVIYDEAHSLGAFPKKSNCTKLARQKFYNLPCILMSGTPSVETASQLYHQFYVSKFSPFKEFTTFYKWAQVYVNKKELRLPTHTVTDYSGAKFDDIEKVINPYMVKMTQADAGFKVNITEHILRVDTPDYLRKLANRLIKNKAVEGKSGYILGDMPAKLQGKVHQILNGHCIIETAEGETFTKVFDLYKVEFIREYFQDKKIAIMYYYQAELEMLKQVFPYSLTTELELFNESDMNIAVQQSSTEGLNLSKADAIVYLNLGFSGKSFIQSRDRLTIKGRKENNVYFICESGGMTEKILETVRQKKSFNSRIFAKEFKI